MLRNDAALLALTRRYDGAKLTAEQLAVTQAEVLSASIHASEALHQSLEFAARNIERFSRRSLRRGWSGRD